MGWINKHNPEVINSCLGIVNIIFCLFLWRVWQGELNTKVIFFLQIFLNTIICCFVLRVFDIWCIWNNPQCNILFLVNRFNFIRYITINVKVLVINQKTIRLFRYYNWIPVIILLKWIYSWSMMNILLRY